MKMRGEQQRKEKSSDINIIIRYSIKYAKNIEIHSHMVYTVNIFKSERKNMQPPVHRDASSECLCTKISF